ncbi:MAG: LicD family protein [Eubacterium sp.]|nr:LicD family protein [Eubacterium sp.]
MKRIDTNELKEIQLQILEYVADFCDRNGIVYWLDSGTLLGAVRHKGYIPWDDDIDIGMLREDYDKFIQNFNNNSNCYKVYSIENKKDFFYPFAKVLDIRTILYEPDRNGNKLSVNIDVFVYDNAPNSDKILEKMYDKRDELRKWAGFKEKPETFKQMVGYSLMLPFRKKWFYEKMVENSKLYAHEEKKYVGNFLGYSRMKCHKRVFAGLKKMEFEGREYNVPIGYDEWLRAFYGNYMELPPVEERITHHTFEAYRVEE